MGRWIRWITAGTVVALTAAACSAVDATDDAPSWDATGITIPVEAGEEAGTTTPDGTFAIHIPAESLTGAGDLVVRPATAADGVDGWWVELTGDVSLSGPAELTFTNVDAPEDSPPPLVAYRTHEGGDLTLAEDVTINGQTATVTTTHFSGWFARWWNDPLGEARALLDALYSGQAAGLHPRCEGEDEVRAAGYSITSDDGARVMWCLGLAADGQPALKVVNARGYAVAAEHTPGMEVSSAGADGLISTLSSWLQAPPSLPENEVTLLASGDEITYTITGDQKYTGVRVQPSPAAYLLTAAQYAVDTGLMISSWLGKGSIGPAAFEKALEIESCLAGFSDMATATVRTPGQAANYLNDAIGTALGCLGPALERLGLNFWGVAVAGGLSWLISGIRTAANGLGAAADTALDPGGYQIVITGPSSPADIAREFLDEQGACLGCSVSGTLEYSHSSGTGTLVTFGPNPEGSPWPDVAAVMVTSEGSVEWWGNGDGVGMYGYKPLGQDASGNIFISYNPGRHDGIQVIVPHLGSANADVAAEVRAEFDAAGYSSYAPPYAQDYYHAEVVDVDDDGTWEIRNLALHCDPSCAGGYITSEDLWLDGDRYRARP